MFIISLFCAPIETGEPTLDPQASQNCTPSKLPDNPTMSVEGPIIIPAMQRSPSLSIDPPSHHIVSAEPLPLSSSSGIPSRPVQMLAPQLHRDRAQSVGDVAPPSSAGPVRRAKSPLVSQVSMAEFVSCVCDYFGIG